MEWLQPLAGAIQVPAIFLVFILMTLLMFYRILPAILALPILAVLLALIGGVAPYDVGEYVVGKGVLKLHGAYVIAIFGGMLSILLQKTAVAENLIKKGAELSGDNPWIVSVTMLILIILLFTTLGGLGAIIMVATIVLPVLSSVGVGPLTAVGIFLLGVSIGGTLNVGNWALYIKVLGLSVDQVRPFALIIFTVVFLLSLVYVTLQLYRDGHAINLKKIGLNITGLLTLALGGLLGYYYLLQEGQRTALTQGVSTVWGGCRTLIGAGLILLSLGVLWQAFQHRNATERKVGWAAFLSPVVPLVLILVFDVPFVSAFILGLLYTFAATYKAGRLNLFIQSCLEGAGVVMPAVLLMFGIGMILVAIMGPGGDLPNYPEGWPVLKLIQPVVKSMIPTHPVLYVLVFTIFAPLALYRGPLNLWGMGFGLAAVFIASGLPAAAVMGLLMSVGQIQGISDPTNTQNVWLANEMRVDVQKVLYNTLPYAWGAAFIGLVCSSLLFLGGQP